MQDVVIVYESKTGNTKKIAKALAETAGERCSVYSVEEITDVPEATVIFAGYGVYRAEPLGAMQEFLATLHNKKVVLFQTLGAEPYSEHGMVSFANSAKFLPSDAKVLGVFSVRGAIDPNFIEKMRQLPAGHPHSASPASEARWAVAASHPDEQDLQNAKEYMSTFLGFYDKFYR